MLLNSPLPPVSPTREAMRAAYRADEDTVLKELLPLADLGPQSRSRIWAKARDLVKEIRAEQKGKGGVDALLNEFSLSTEEGIVLMCLAEALLRVPDDETTEHLIRDKLSAGDWSSHLGNSDSIFVNASAWGLLLTGKLVNYSDKDKKAQFGLLKKTLGNLGEPVIRASVRYAMQIMGAQFVMGKTIDAAIKRATKQEAKGYRYSYDMLGEGARTEADAQRYFDSYMDAIHAIGKAANGRGPVNSPGISVKLSAIHPRYHFSHRDRVMNELVPKLKELAMTAKSYDIGFTVDAEEADRLDISLDIIEAVFTDKDLDGWEGFGLAVQAYQKRARHVLDFVKHLAETAGRKMMVRLVKGAYWDSEIKWSQTDGYEDFPVFTRKPSTDVSYQACARILMGYRDYIYPQFATHNAYTVAAILEMDDLADANQRRQGYEFQRLHGMGEALFDQTVEDEGLPCRVYAPVGKHADLLAYLVRRLLENGANSSFVNNIVDENISIESLLQDPVEQVKSWKTARNPQIPLPKDLYGANRANSKGIDLTHIPAILPMAEKMEAYIRNATANLNVSADEVAVKNPANKNEIVGKHVYASPKQMQEKLAMVSDGFNKWSSTPVKERAELLRKLGFALEDHFDELMAICVKEAGKNIADSVAEIREAVDFCHYYANQAEDLYENHHVKPRGVILCISPWNFPLAIFLGQVTAALAAGNTVLAKPAEQTSMIAEYAVGIMKQVGFPDDALQLIVSTGKPVGETLIPDSRIRGVMFTGSTETGLWIANTLASREDFANNHDVPLIAETGGQNAMIVDSTALPEQVVDDVINSGFQSAGQRCSALRLLFLQEEVADKIIDMIKGAMKELHIGDPADLATDVGPVIDQKALDTLNAHVDFMKDKGQLIYECALPEDCAHGNYFTPKLYEIEDISILEREVFGPVVHVVRYKAKELDNVIDTINNTGYGLTFGVHTRIERKANYIASRMRVGNVYVNRNMIGAIVGVQPFGGRGLSGTGPKAGGPQYLTKLVEEIAPVKLYEHQLTINGDANVPVELADVDWHNVPVLERTSIIRQVLSHMAADHSFHMDEAELDLLRMQLRQAEHELVAGIKLPGPTGESNSLYVEHKGPMVLVIDNHQQLEDWASLFTCAIAAGNPVTIASESMWLSRLETMIEWLEQSGMTKGTVTIHSINELPGLIQHPDLSGVICPTASAYLQEVKKLAANRQGAILPVLQNAEPKLELHMMLTEKTISIDTTAAGGNASLMTLAI